MDEEDQNTIFSDFEKRELNQEYFEDPFHEQLYSNLSESLHIEKMTLKSRSPSLQEASIVEQNSGTYIKAYNPMQMIENMLPQKQKEYLRIANSSKNFNGLQFFFQTQEYQAASQGELTFLSGINETVFAFDNEPKSGELSKLFQMQAAHQTQKDHIHNLISQLRGKMGESQQRCFNSIMLTKTIGSAFYEHFQNFSFVSNPSNFFQELQSNLINFINHAKRIKGPGPQLISSIYDFWMKTFKDFVNQIWKYSSKYTLNFLKKQKFSETSDRSDSTARKETFKEKRKNWSLEEIKVLQKIIDSNVIFSQNKLRDLSEELGRSVNSISSKIQKIIKSKKGEQYQEESLLKKTIQVLKLSPEGLNKETIIQKINEYYEMGYDGQWEKSVGQLLSSRKEFSKIKGKYRLINGEKYLRNKMEEENNEKLTFKDKVIRCLIQFQHFEADLRSLIEMYISLYGEQQAIGNNNQDKRKFIEASISKTLSRYDIFDTSNSKTIYQYLLCESLEKPKSPCQDYGHFLNL